MSISAWTPASGYPSSTPTVLQTVATSLIPSLESRILSAQAQMATMTQYAGSQSQIIRGAQASLTIASAQEGLTASVASVQAQATQDIVRAMYNLQQLAAEQNLYGHELLHAGNIIFFGVFLLVVLFNVGMLFWSRYHWYNVTFCIGYLLEMIGFLCRVLSLGDPTHRMYYILQYSTLTMAPAFIMAGIYFTFAQNIAVYGRQYSVLKPMHYLYVFLGADICSILVQAGGGAYASANSDGALSLSIGTWIMFGGILFQVFCMTGFLFFFFDFTMRIFFQDRSSVPSESPYTHKNAANYAKMLVNVPSARRYKEAYLEAFYEPSYGSIRERPLVMVPVGDFRVRGGDLHPLRLQGGGVEAGLWRLLDGARGVSHGVGRHDVGDCGALLFAVSPHDCLWPRQQVEGVGHPGKGRREGVYRTSVHVIGGESSRRVDCPISEIAMYQTE